ncbi:MAG: hypothetical protein IKB88_05455 [Clostridia bacterium]|nr:hypothetical protein [Clostridia bacterium]
MKKTISIFLAMLMIMPFAVPFASAADAIGTIAVTIDTADLGGKSVDSYADYVTIGTEGVIFEESNGPAVEAFNKTTESYDSEFEGGNYYTFTVKLTEAPYYALPAAGSFAEVEVNGSKYAALVQEKNTVSGTISYILFEIELYVGDPMKNLKAIDFHVPAPVAGAVPADLSQVTADNMGVIIVGIEWFPEDPVFVEGTQYSFQLALETAEGFTFDKNIYLSHDMADAIKIGSGKNELKMTYTFPILEAEKIIGADFTIPAPVTGETPAATAEIVCDNPNITVASVDWDPVDDPYKLGIEYTAIISIEANSYYKFDSASAFTVNGQNAVKIGSGAEELKVCYTFPATEKIKISELNATVIAPVAGEAPSNVITTTGTGYTVSVLKWLVSGNPTETITEFKQGKNYEIQVKFVPDNGYVFADDVTAKINDKNAFLCMENSVTGEKTFVIVFTLPLPEYNISVTNGIASASKAVAGTTVTLTADAAPAGKVFDKWIVTGATVADATSASTTFTMPENDVTAEATYKDKTYNVSVTNGKASASTAVMGGSITLTANQIDGKVFSRWEVSGAAASDKNAKETSVTVGTSDVTAEAIYEDCPCKCHKGGIAGFFYKIVLFFQKLFGNNKICVGCGAKH